MKQLWLCSFPLVALLAACDGDSAAPPKSEVTVRVVPAAMQSYEDSIALTGEIAARVSYDVSFRVSGRLVERRVDVGDHVARGDVLARVDPRQQEAYMNAAAPVLGPPRCGCAWLKPRLSGRNP